MDLLMELHLEKILIYGSAILLCVIVVAIYLLKQKRESKIVDQKIEEAKEKGLFEPVSLHPVVNPDTCIKSGACISACPEKDILGIRNGKATLINASRCIGHGACFHACPVEAITLVIGTEKRGVDLPHINHSFETNIPGIYIAGELGGMGLIKNGVEQGKQAVQNIVKTLPKSHSIGLDLVIVGSGPAGISASLESKKNGIKFATLEQDTIGGTVFSFPRSKIVMTSPMDLPLYGNIKLFETSKSELIDLWHEVLNKNDIRIHENTKVEEIVVNDKFFTVKAKSGELFNTKNVLLAIGRRGSPRKLGVTGEGLGKVAYRLLEPEHIQGKNILVVGGGDSAIESALLLTDNNKVTLSYRKDKFSRIKPKNLERIEATIKGGKIDIQFNTNVKEIKEDQVILSSENEDELILTNDLVYIFAGGELPTKFLEKIGIQITKRFGYAILSHKKNNDGKNG
jgi:thioredoxin reductase/NAD-dependent dihydropyrimidine dehydrogenase PreA subunit